MANWTGFSMTNRGAALQAKVNTGSTTLTFTKLAIGSGEASGSIESLTELAHKEIDMPIKGISNDGNIVTIKSTITNSGISQAFYAREMGLYAQDPDLGEILYAIQIDPNPDNIPASGSATVVSEEFEAHLIMSNTGNVSAVLDSSALVTLGDLDKHNESEDSHPDIRQKITDDIDAHNSLASAHPAMDFVKSLSSADDGLHYTMRNESEDRVIDIVSVGDVAFRYKLAPGWVKANGATVKRSDYPKLVQFATDNDLFTSSPTSNPQLFGQGDGNTTFILPDLRNRFIEGGDTIGVKSAGLPNITGTTKLNGGPWYTANMDSGALYQEEIHSSDSSGRNSNGLSINFDASRSNSIYGASDTVQPAAIVLIPQIKY